VEAEKTAEAVDVTEKQLLWEYIQAKGVRDSFKSQYDNAKAGCEVKERELIEYLESSGATATKRYKDLGYAQIPKPRLYASCRQENMDKLFAFLKAQGREDLIKTTVMPQSLSSFASECVSEGVEMPDVVNYYFKSSIRLYS